MWFSLYLNIKWGSLEIWIILIFCCFFKSLQCFVQFIMIMMIIIVVVVNNEQHFIRRRLTNNGVLFAVAITNYWHHYKFRRMFFFIFIGCQCLLFQHSNSFQLPRLSIWAGPKFASNFYGLRPSSLLCITCARPHMHVPVLLHLELHKGRIVFIVTLWRWFEHRSQITVRISSQQDYR